jgi:hypothetical protein
MKIKSIKVTNLQNKEHFQFMFEVNDVIKMHTPESVDIKELHTVFEQQLLLESEAFKVIPKNALTKQVTEADIRRDLAFSGLRTQIKSLQTHFNSEVKESAYRLWVLINGYGNLTFKSYDKKTAGIYNLLQDLTSNKYKGDVEKTGLISWIPELDDANQAFEALIQKRDEDQSEKSAVIKMRDARLQINEAYNQIVNRINAGIEYNGPSKYEAFVLDLNTRIDRYNLNLAQRHGRIAAKKKKDDHTPTLP